MSPTADARAFVRQVQDALSAAADPEKAAPMQAYMKSAMPFYGVQKPARARIVRRLLDERPFSDRDAWRTAVLTLWARALRREERYVALDILGDRRYRSFRTASLLPDYEQLIVEGAWWDWVDELAVGRVGELFDTAAVATRRAVRRWIRHEDLWLRRSAII